MTIGPLIPSTPQWHQTAAYAGRCPWRGGQKLAKRMAAGQFSDWERVFAAWEKGRIVGYCTLTKKDCFPQFRYTPYIGSLFVDERCRGRRYSEKLIGAALAHAKGLGFERVYLASDHVGLYEKYGFVKIDEKPAPWDAGKVETIFMYEM